MLNALEEIINLFNFIEKKNHFKYERLKTSLIKMFFIEKNVYHFIWEARKCAFEFTYKKERFQLTYI